jgi:peptide/nickel transport system substrate-binding protein
VDQVLPSVFHVGPDFSYQLDRNFVVSARLVSTTPETILYQINPKAVWADGTPITYKDFVYAYQAQSGLPRYQDAGGQPFTPAITSGYSDIASVTQYGGSPFGVKVVFSATFPDWQALFHPLIPSQVGSKVGFDDGFSDPVTDLVSGGPFMVQTYVPGVSLTLVRNPTYWGPPAGLASVTFLFITDSSQITPALQAGQVDAAILSAPQMRLLPDIGGLSGIAIDAGGSTGIEALDFNQSSLWLADPAVREAVMLSIDRRELMASVSGGARLQPLGNRFFVPGEPGYRDNSGQLGTANIALARQILQRDGFRLDAAGRLTRNGKEVTLVIASAAGDELAPSVAAMVASEVAAIGITLSPAAQPLVDGSDFDLLVHSSVAGRLPAAADHLNDPQAGRLVALASQTLDSTARVALYNEADVRLWQDLVNLPLFQLPAAVVYQRSYGNVEADPSSEGPAFDMQAWGQKPPS